MGRAASGSRGWIAAPLLVLLGLLLLGGCASPATDDTHADREDLTPVPIPVDDHSAGDRGADGEERDADGRERDADSGIDATGVTDPEVLATAHVARLDDGSLRERTWTMYDRGEPLLQYTEVLRRGGQGDVVRTTRADGEAVGLVLRDRDDASSLHERRVATAHVDELTRTVDGETMHAPTDGAEPLPALVNPDPTESDAAFVEATFSIPTNVTAGSSGADSRGLRVAGVADAPPDELVAPWLDEARTATLEASVTVDGFVRSLTLSYRADFGDRTVVVTYRIRYEVDDGAG